MFMDVYTCGHAFIDTKLIVLHTTPSIDQNNTEAFYAHKHTNITVGVLDVRIQHYISSPPDTVSQAGLTCIHYL